MSLFQSVGGKLKKGRHKVMKDDRRLKSSKFNAQKMVVALFYILLVAVIAFSYLSFTRTGFLNNKLNAYQQKADAQAAAMNTMGVANSAAGELYAKKFISTYINIPIEDDSRKERVKNLSKFLAEGMRASDLEDLSTFKGKRVLTGAVLYRVQDVKDAAASYVYRVQFKTTVSEEVPVTSNKKTAIKKTKTKMVVKDQQDSLIVVRLGTDGQNFNVIQQPYFLTLPVDARLAPVQDQTDPSLVAADAKDEVRQFLGQFFTSYSQSSLKDMSYLMDDPESLGGLYYFKGLDNYQLYRTAQPNTYTVKTLATFTAKGTGVYMKQPFTLVVEKQNDKYYVKSLKHTLGE